MKNENKRLDKLFNHFEGQWDLEEPSLGHQERFLNKLNGKKKKKSLLYRISIPAAAAIVIVTGIMLTSLPGKQQVAVKVSPQTEKTQLYFASIIEKELAKVEKEDSPETKKLVQDALLHMQELERDYTKITQELEKKGENKQLIHAMITNLQTRISFLEDVLTKIENIKKIKANYHEDTQT